MRNAPTEAEIAALFQLQGPEVCRKIAEISRYIQFSNNESILTIGQRQGQILFLVEGIARFYYIDPAGREHTLCFCETPGYPLMVHINTAGSFSGAHAVGQLRALTLPTHLGMALVGRYSELMGFYNRILNQALLFHAEIAVMLRGSTPQQRYAWLCNRMPQAAKTAQKRHIASFLGITPETLSRVLSKAPSEPPPLPVMYQTAQVQNSDALWDQVEKPQFSPSPK